jgi:hypothetical protein
MGIIMIADNCKTGLVKRAKQFFRNSCGGMSVGMGLTMIPLLLAAGVGVDTVRLTREQAAFQTALDSAVIALAADDRSAVEGLTDTPGSNPPAGPRTDRINLLKDYAMKYVNSNYTREKGSNAEIKLHLEITGGKINLKARHTFPTTFMRLAGIDTMELGFEAEVEKAMRPVEVVLVMDTTGSMAETITVNTPLPAGVTSSSQINTKIESAQFAAKKFLDNLYTGTLSVKPSSPYIRVALVPFAAAVRLDTAETDVDFFDPSWIDINGDNELSRIHFMGSSNTPPSTWNNFTAWSSIRETAGKAHTWNGCVEARRYGTGTGNLHINDDEPNPATPATLFPAYFSPDVFGISSDKSNDYGANYIGATRTASSWGPWYLKKGKWVRDVTGYTGTRECLGLGQCNAEDETSDQSLLLNQQENYLKYVDAVLGTEAASSSGGPWQNCTKTPIIPLTYDRGTVVTAINAMKASGNTVISEGVAWGNRVLSPSEPFTHVKGYGTAAETAKAVIAPYNSPRWMKVMLLMTDGDNNVNSNTKTFNRSSYSAYGLQREPAGSTNRFEPGFSPEASINRFTTAACNMVKANNVTLYVSSFGDDILESTKTMLRGCATKTEYYRHADTANDLVAAFDHFGTDTVNKMVYVSK